MRQRARSARARAPRRRRSRTTSSKRFARSWPVRSLWPWRTRVEHAHARQLERERARPGRGPAPRATGARPRSGPCARRNRRRRARRPRRAPARARPPRSCAAASRCARRCAPLAARRVERHLLDDEVVGRRSGAPAPRPAGPVSVEERELRDGDEAAGGSRRDRARGAPRGARAWRSPCGRRSRSPGTRRRADHERVAVHLRDDRRRGDRAVARVAADERVCAASMPGIVRASTSTWSGATPSATTAWRIASSPA